MGAIGFAMLCACGVRIFFDDPKMFPMTTRNKEAWGLVLVIAVVLIFCSIIKAIWENMP